MKNFLLSCAIFGAIVFGAWFAFVNCSTIIEPGYIAVLKTMGVVDEEPHSNGWVLHWPFGITKVIPFDVREKSSDLAVPARLSNGMEITIKGAINYKLVGENLPKLYVGVGDDYNRIDSVLILPLLKGAINFTIGDRSAEFVICQRRMVREAIAYIIEDQWSKNNWLELVDLQLYSPEFDAGIDQAYLDLARVRIETLQVEEEAKQMLLRAEAEAKSLELKSKAVTNPLLIKYIVAEALKENWRGDVPQTLVIGADAAAILGGK